MFYDNSKELDQIDQLQVMVEALQRERDTARRRVDELESREIDVELLQADLAEEREKVAAFTQLNKKLDDEVRDIARSRDTLQAALDAAQDEATQWFRAARLQREASRDLRALVRALPMVKGKLKVCHGTFYYVQEAKGPSSSILCGLIEEPNLATAIMALLEYRRTLDTTMPAGSTT